VQRGQCHPALRSCQFSYPLPFRGQVCEAQSSLPCCPSAVLSSRRPPFLDRVPVSPVPRRHQYYEGATTPTRRITGRLFVSLPVPTQIPPRFVLADASAPGRVEVPPRAGIIGQPAIQLPACSHVGVSGTSQVSRQSVLCLCPVLRPRPNQRTLASNGCVDAAPANRRAEASAYVYIEAIAGLQHMLSTLHEGCYHCPCKTRFRVAGSPFPRGS
jgi:hypothetical protein